MEGPLPHSQMTSLVSAVVMIAGVALPQSGSGAAGFRAEGTILLEAVANLDGGVRPDAAGLYLLRGSLALDGRVLGANGLRGHLTALVTGGTPPGDFVGDAQGTSNIAAADAVWPYEAWLQQNVGRWFSVLGGIYDVNSEFDALDAAGVFLHSSFGMGADFGLSGANGPSVFPATGLGVRLAAAPREDLRVRLVAADGTPGNPTDPGRPDLAWREDDGVLLAGEMVRRLGGPVDDIRQGPRRGRRFLGRGSLRQAPGKVGLGVWRYEGVRGARLGGTPWGVYVLAEGRLPGTGVGSTDPAVFGRAGLAAGSPVRGYVGAGATTTGPLRVRPEDEVGLGVAVAWPDPALLESVGQPRDTAPEAVIELSYRLSLSPGLFVQPDLQLVANPLYASGTGHAVVGIIRLGAFR